MKIVVCSHSDYANYAYLNALAMRAVGLDADAFILKPHPFNYPIQAHRVGLERIKKECADADIIIVMHSCGTMFDVVKYLNKPTYVFHTGTRYRQNRAKYDELWSRIDANVVVALGEFDQPGTQYMSVTVDDTSITPDYTHRNNTFGHFPSNSVVKGTSAIRRAFQDTGTALRFDNRAVSYTRNLMRIGTVDFYIELFNPMQKDQMYGSFGTTAAESAAMGKVVITQNLHEEFYLKHYSKTPGIIFVKTFDDLMQSIRDLSHLSIPEVREKKEYSREWVEKNHGLIASGNRMKTILGI